MSPLKVLSQAQNNWRWPTETMSALTFVVQDLLLDGVILNSVSLYNDPLNSNIDEIFGDTDIILITDDQGGY